MDGWSGVVVAGSAPTEPTAEDQLADAVVGVAGVAVVDIATMMAAAPATIPRAATADGREVS